MITSHIKDQTVSFKAIISVYCMQKLVGAVVAISQMLFDLPEHA